MPINQVELDAFVSTLDTAFATFNDTVRARNLKVAKTDLLQTLSNAVLQISDLETLRAAKDNVISREQLTPCLSRHGVIKLRAVTNTMHFALSLFEEHVFTLTERSLNERGYANNIPDHINPAYDILKCDPINGVTRWLEYMAYIACKKHHLTLTLTDSEYYLQVARLRADIDSGSLHGSNVGLTFANALYDMALKYERAEQHKIAAAYYIEAALSGSVDAYRRLDREKNKPSKTRWKTRLTGEEPLLLTREYDNKFLELVCLTAGIGCPNNKEAVLEELSQVPLDSSDNRTTIEPFRFLFCLVHLSRDYFNREETPALLEPILAQLSQLRPHAQLRLAEKLYVPDVGVVASCERERLDEATLQKLTGYNETALELLLFAETRLFNEPRLNFLMGALMKRGIGRNTPRENPQLAGIPLKESAIRGFGPAQYERSIGFRTLGNHTSQLEWLHCAVDNGFSPGETERSLADPFINTYDLKWSTHGTTMQMLAKGLEPLIQENAAQLVYLLLVDARCDLAEKKELLNACITHYGKAFTDALPPTCRRLILRFIPSLREDLQEETSAQASSAAKAGPAEPSLAAEAYSAAHDEIDSDLSLDEGIPLGAM